MISLRKRFLFVHVQKTAGNSIQRVLSPYSEDRLVALRDSQDGVERFGLRSFTGTLKKHSGLADYRAALGEAEFATLYKFTCARNPWDRMISYYFTPRPTLSAWDRGQFQALVSRVPSLVDFLRLDEGETDPFANVDYIMRFERLPEDFRAVCAALKISPASLPRYNRSERDHYSRYYDDELRELVRARFSTEIERFGYVFERP